jgi:hypothetical protein
MKNLDFKGALTTAFGVVLGMVAFHFVSKMLNERGV